MLEFWKLIGHSAAVEVEADAAEAAVEAHPTGEDYRLNGRGFMFKSYRSFRLSKFQIVKGLSRDQFDL
jgi:hypothetical protein